MGPKVSTAASHLSVVGVSCDRSTNTQCTAVQFGTLAIGHLIRPFPQVELLRRVPGVNARDMPPRLVWHATQ
jgi:hypothetical protein